LSREFGQIPEADRGFFGSGSASQRLKAKKFPVLCLFNREFHCGEQFASACVLHTRVFNMERNPTKCAKSAQVGRFVTSKATGEVPAWEIAGLLAIFSLFQI
jgi:hypothetical protein